MSCRACHAHRSSLQTDKEPKSSSTAAVLLRNGEGGTDQCTAFGQASNLRCEYERATGDTKGRSCLDSVLTKPEHVQAFYKDSHMHTKAADNNSGWLFGELLGLCVGVVSHERWRTLRKPFEAHFTRSASVRKVRPFVTEAGQFLACLKNNGRGGECIINAANDLKFCPFFMVASIFFGELTTETRNELAMLGPLREALFRDTFMGGISRYAIGKYLPGSAMLRLRNFQRRWASLVRRAYEEADAGKQHGAAMGDLWVAMENGDISMQEASRCAVLRLRYEIVNHHPGSFSKPWTNHCSPTWTLQLMLWRGMYSGWPSTPTSSKTCGWNCIHKQVLASLTAHTKNTCAETTLF